MICVCVCVCAFLRILVSKCKYKHKWRGFNRDRKIFWEHELSCWLPVQTILPVLFIKTTFPLQFLAARRKLLPTNTASRRSERIVNVNRMRSALKQSSKQPPR